MKAISAIDLATLNGSAASVTGARFHLPRVLVAGEATFHYWEVDRTVIGGVVPVASPLALPQSGLLGGPFLARRELGVINLGGPGTVEVEGTVYRLERLDGLYLGRGAGESVVFTSLEPRRPARFYVLSYPAHTTCPTRLLKAGEVPAVELGQPTAANLRTLRKYIAPGLIESCQLVMGVTTLHPGNVWNTMPPHLHVRRSEVYLYFDVPADQVVFHLYGEPTQTRHLVVRDGEAALSPSWSIHAGVGTAAYSFVWGMGGENQDFADIEPVPVTRLG